MSNRSGDDVNLLGKVYADLKVSEIREKLSFYTNLLVSGKLSSLAVKRVTAAEARVLSIIQTLEAFAKSEVVVHREFNDRILSSCHTELIEMRDVVREDVGKIKYAFAIVKSHYTKSFRRLMSLIGLK